MTVRRRTRRLLGLAVLATFASACLTLAGTQVLAASPRPHAGAAKRKRCTPKRRRRGLCGKVRQGPPGDRGFTGPQGAQGPQGAPGPMGATGANGRDVVAPLTINWQDSANASGHDVAVAAVPNIGQLVATCNVGSQRLVLNPARSDVRTVAAWVVYQGAGATAASYTRQESTSGQLAIPLPQNGMVTATFSIQPIGGNGGPGPSPATLTLSSEWKITGPTPAQNCYVAAQLLGGPQ